MTEAALTRVSGYSRGIPRLINAICDKALLAASHHRKKEISSDIVVEVAEFLWDEGLPNSPDVGLAPPVAETGKPAPETRTPAPESRAPETAPPAGKDARPRRVLSRLLLYGGGAIALGAIGVLYASTSERWEGWLRIQQTETGEIARALEAARDTIAGHVTRLLVQDQEIERLTKEHGDLTNSIAELRDQREVLEAETEFLRAELDEVSGNAAQADRTIASLSRQIDEAKQSLADHRGEASETAPPNTEAQSARAADAGLVPSAGSVTDLPAWPTDVPIAPAPTVAAIADGLARAERQIAANRLTLPPGDNALESYREILRLHPDHAEALAGIEKLTGQFRYWAQIALENGETAKALTYYQKL